ncbi:MAG: hypothetical protein JWQ55_5363, partial [Rhodopila sp.]|nr:hypothetical protein [Rhodopila sp.]
MKRWQPRSSSVSWPTPSVSPPVPHVSWP